MSRPGDSVPTDLLEELLGEVPSVLPFARAVLRHLCGQPVHDDAARVEMACEIASFFQAGEGSAGSEGVARLARKPELLASFFQNADLLDPGSAEADFLGRLVMGALGTFEDDGRSFEDGRR